MGLFKKKPLWPENKFAPKTFNASDTSNEQSKTALDSLIDKNLLPIGMSNYLKEILTKINSLIITIEKLDENEQVLYANYLRKLKTARDVDLPNLVSAYLLQTKENRDEQICIDAIGEIYEHINLMSMEITNKLDDNLKIETIFIKDKYHI